MLNCYETQRARETNIGHHVAAKKNVSIVQFLADTFLYVWLF